MSQPLVTADLAAITAAQACHTLFAFDYAETPRQLARLQHLYASKLAQLDTLRYIFDEGTPELRLRSPSREVLLCPGEGFNYVRQSLLEFIEQELGSLEREIVEVHLKLQEEASDTYQLPPGAEYAPAIRALCQPEATAGYPLP